MRSLLLTCLATTAWAFGFGSGSQLVSHWMIERDASSELIGWNHSCYYFGLAAASLAVPAVARRWGPRAAALGMLGCGPTLALFPWAGGPLGWFVLRFLNGAFSSLSLIPLEALVSRNARPAERARDFAFYGVALTLGGAVGMSAGLNLYEANAIVAFYVSSAAPVLGGLVLLRWLRPEAATDEEAAPVPLAWRRHFLSFGTAWSQGFLEGGMVAFLALYLETRGLTADRAGDLMGLMTIGVMLLQVPISWLADRLGRVPVLLGCYAIVMVGLILAPWTAGLLALACCLFAFAACAGAMYPMGMALLGEGLPESSLARTYAWYLAIECVGSLMGPPAMGFAIDRLGGGSMFLVGSSAVGLVVVAWVVVREPRPQAGERPGEPLTRKRGAA
jgi:MFS family permease